MGFWEPLFFWIFTVGVLATSVAVVVFRNPLYSALALIADFFCFAGLYVLLSAHFMAVIQILVYGGAIMVLFLFIIMLLNLSDDELGPRLFSLHQVLAAAASLAIFVFAASSIVAVVDFDAVDTTLAEAKTQQDEAQAQAEQNPDAEPTSTDQIVEVKTAIPGLYAFNTEDAVEMRYAQKVHAWDAGETTYSANKFRRFNDDQPDTVPPGLLERFPVAEHPGKTIGPDGKPVAIRGGRDKESGDVFGTVEPISLFLVNRFVLPFELTAVLLLAAIIGAVVLAKKRI